MLWVVFDCGSGLMTAMAHHHVWEDAPTEDAPTVGFSQTVLHFVLQNELYFDFGKFHFGS